MYKTIWCKLENGYFVNIRSFNAEQADKKAREWTEDCSIGRQYIAFEQGTNPNA